MDNAQNNIPETSQIPTLPPLLYTAPPFFNQIPPSNDPEQSKNIVLLYTSLLFSFFLLFIITIREWTQCIKIRKTNFVPINGTQIIFSKIFYFPSYFSTFQYI